MLRTTEFSSSTEYHNWVHRMGNRIHIRNVSQHARLVRWSGYPQQVTHYAVTYDDLEE